MRWLPAPAAKPCTALYIGNIHPRTHRATSGLCVWVETGEYVDLDGLSELAPQLADLQLLDVYGDLHVWCDPDSDDVRREALQEQLQHRTGRGCNTWT